MPAAAPQMHAVEDDRHRLADELNATVTASSSLTAGRLAQLEAQLAAKDAQLLAERTRVAR